MDKITIKLLDSIFVKSKTNGGDLAKQYFKYIILVKGKTQSAILIRKYILTKDLELYQGYKIIRRFKDKYLLFTSFSLKPSTMKTVLDWINLVENQNR